MMKPELAFYLERQKSWSVKTFGDSKRTLGLTKHIRKELDEIEVKPDDLLEWVDVIILAMDGFWRHGGKPEQLSELIDLKQRMNMSRTFPKTLDSEPSEHLK